MAAEPIAHGTVSIRDGRIVAVEQRGQRAADIDLGNVAIIPGLVNAHTHLDLSGLKGKSPPQTDFTGWLKSVIAHRRTRSPEQVLDDARNGLAQALQYGTTLIADIAGEGATWPLLANAPCRAVVFREILGLPAHRVMQVWKHAMTWAAEHPDTDSCQAGLSPHAPYSVHHSLIRAAGTVGMLNTIHLAETVAELELLDEHRGPFVDFLNELGVWDDDGLARSIDWILWQSTRSAGTLLAHGNYLSLDAVVPKNATIVYCPRTHAAFGHASHPFREFLERGVRVALGTDSLASNPDLDVLSEARFIHERFPDFPGDRLLKMATLWGAEALQLDHDVGSLEVGKSADLVVVPLANQEVRDPHRLLFERKADELGSRKTMWKGMWRSEALPPS